jgi:hypothetical protein
MTNGKRIIVTTTIYPPTNATLAFCEKKDWEFIIVGDLKTPHERYRELEKKYPHVSYLAPEDQEKKYKALSDVIGWNNIQRRNIGFVEAYRRGAEIMATVDDDNIPYETWGKNVLVNQEAEIDLYEPNLPVFDPLSVTRNNFIWHRGYPIEYLEERKKVRRVGKTKRHVLIQADLWDGDPDIDAIARLAFRPIVKFDDVANPYGSNKVSPFNSQNTFLAREVLPYYAVLPYVGRMDDIWGGYLTQYHFPNSLIYCPASVYQDRNPQDPITNLEKEIFGYRNTLPFLANLETPEVVLPEKAFAFWKSYRREFT